MQVQLPTLVFRNRLCRCVDSDENADAVAYEIARNLESRVQGKFVFRLPFGSHLPACPRASLKETTTRS